MTTTYSWEVNSLINKTVSGNPKTVVQISAFRVATDSDSGVMVHSGEEINFIESEINLSSLVPFNDLTEETVTGWIESSISEEYLSEIDSILQKLLTDAVEEAANPKLVDAPPWS